MSFEPLFKQGFDQFKANPLEDKPCSKRLLVIIFLSSVEDESFNSKHRVTFQRDVRVLDVHCYVKNLMQKSNGL